MEPASKQDSSLSKSSSFSCSGQKRERALVLGFEYVRPWGVEEKFSAAFADVSSLLGGVQPAVKPLLWCQLPCKRPAAAVAVAERTLCCMHRIGGCSACIWLPLEAAPDPLSPVVLALWACCGGSLIQHTRLAVLLPRQQPL